MFFPDKRQDTVNLPLLFLDERQETVNLSWPSDVGNSAAVQPVLHHIWTRPTRAWPPKRTRLRGSHDSHDPARRVSASCVVILEGRIR